MKSKEKTSKNLEKSFNKIKRGDEQIKLTKQNVIGYDDLMKSLPF